MLIDFLRYSAYEGRYAPFFLSEGYLRFADHSMVTGLHLRFTPIILGHPWLRNRTARQRALIALPDNELQRLYGISRKSPSSNSKFRIGKPPPTSEYNDDGICRIQLVIDISPKYWRSEYERTEEFEGAQVVYRRSGPARGHFVRGNGLYCDVAGSKRRSSLCAIISTSKTSYALTCGHGTDECSVVRAQNTDSKSSRGNNLGCVAYREVPSAAYRSGRIETFLDAALIEIGSGEYTASRLRKADVVPIKSLRQERAVYFRGSARREDRRARIAAVTVWKEIDLFNNGKLICLGDLLMLGYARHEYLKFGVSKPGDSGAAVRLAQDYEPRGPERWCGMIVGGDDTGSFASYAECIHDWVVQYTDEPSVEYAI